MAQNRETFGSRFAVVAALAGSAIGLGNIWRFPYLVGEGGGAAFIIIYLLSSIFLALPIFLSESIIGRTTHKGTFGAFNQLAPGTGWKWASLLTVTASLIVVSYYSVVGGWSIDYLAKSLTLSFNTTSADAVGGMFEKMIAAPWIPLLCHTVFLGLTCLIVIGGVKKGIERFAKITTPMLFVLIVLIMIFSVSLPGAGEGVRYMIHPDFSKVTGKVVASAMGQAFFSLSLGVGVILIYSSYMKDDENIFETGFGTAIFDLMFALLAGFAVMPAVFAAGIEPGTGPGLIFSTLPYIFAKMGLTMPWLSAAVSILFFLTILVAALTSSISMVEVVVGCLSEEKGMSRKKATAWVFAVAWVIGCLCSLSFGPLGDVKILGSTIFEACDKLVSNYLMSFGGLLFTIFVGWKMSRKAVRDEFTCGGTQKANCAIFNVVYFLIKFVAPIGIAVIFLTNLFL